MNTIDKMNGYTLTNTNGTWSIETDNNTNVRIIITTIWDKFTRITKACVNIPATGSIAPEEAANLGEEIIRASKAANYFTDVIALYENGTLK